MPRHFFFIFPFKTQTFVENFALRHIFQEFLMAHLLLSAIYFPMEHQINSREKIFFFYKLIKNYSGALETNAQNVTCDF